MTEQYPWILAWGSLRGYRAEYTKAQVERAIAENAPADAVYRHAHNTRWMTIDDIESSRRRALLGTFAGGELGVRAARRAGVIEQACLMQTGMPKRSEVARRVAEYARALDFEAAAAHALFGLTLPEDAQAAEPDSEESHGEKVRRRTAAFRALTPEDRGVLVDVLRAHGYSVVETEREAQE